MGTTTGNFIDIGTRKKGDPKFFIDLNEVVTIFDYGCYQGRQVYAEHKKDPTMINASGRNAVNSILILKGGFIAASSLEPEEIMRIIKKSKRKGIDYSIDVIDENGE